MVGKELFRVPDDVRPQLVPEERLAEIMTAPNDQQLALAGRAILEPISRSIMLQIVDQQWKDHLYSLDHLKEGIGLRGYGQRDPLVEYKKESFTLFQAMKGRIDEEMVRYLWRLRPVIETERRRRPGGAGRAEASAGPEAVAADVQRHQGASAAALGGLCRDGAAAAARRPTAPRPARVGGDDAAVKQVRRDEPKVGRNDPCPCGSGKKYKKCHGANQ